MSKRVGLHVGLRYNHRESKDGLNAGGTAEQRRFAPETVLKRSSGLFVYQVKVLLHL